MGSCSASAVAHFTVTVTAKEVVAAGLPLQERRLPFSNLDLVLPRAPIDFSVFFCYSGKKTTTSFGEKAGALKRALVETLVSFYPFAGEVVENSAGELEIDCNNRGVDFWEASAPEVELGDVNFYEPDTCVKAKLVPNKKHGVLSVQITELAFGATIVGCTFDHHVADAYTANMFLVAWAHMATSAAAAVTPSFCRSLLTPRHPLSFDSSIDDIFTTYSLPSSAPSAATGPAMISRIYHLPAAQLSTLQTRATKTTTHRKMPSKIKTASSYLWKLIAEHAAQLPNDDVLTQNTCKIGIAVDGRQRVGPTMSSYFGNVLSVPYASYGVNELTKMTLGDVAEIIDRFLASPTTKEHFLGLVDWVEAHRPKPIVAKVYTQGSEADPAFVVSSGQRFPVAEVDFGWGKPVFGSYYFPNWGGSAGYVMPMPSPNDNGDWIVYMLLLESQLNFIEKIAPSVFKPFALDLLHTKPLLTSTHC